MVLLRNRKSSKSFKWKKFNPGNWSMGDEGDKKPKGDSETARQRDNPKSSKAGSCSIIDPEAP